MNRLAFGAALLGLASVAFGAFGAHAFDAGFSAEARGWWSTATAYALPHAVAALAIGLSEGPRWMRTGGWCLVVGAAIFAATLYAMALGAPGALGAVTPVGGALMLLGWLGLAVAAMRR